MSSSSLVQDESSAFSDRFPGSYNFEKHSSNSCTRFFAICLAWCLHVAEIESNNYCDTKHLKVVYVTICSGLHVSITFIGHMWADCHMEYETSPSLSVAYTNTPVDDLLKSMKISLWGTGWIRLHARSGVPHVSASLHSTIRERQ